MDFRSGTRLRHIAMEALLRLIAEMVLVFAYCKEDEVDSDFAISQLELISYQLRSCEQTIQDSFIQTVREMAAEAAQNGKMERSSQLMELPEHMGFQ